ncbi:glycosyltransferase family 4 protein [Oceanobacillus damuensis]|uniref:glycosyltransferase family 4 protein n=1 Tax=Oceanobacillus damuensis TaxID=937928 RepID=UPI000835D068|nr:glycosyltransferase family 4 protein [Oceanobacillus damuensis]
MKICHLTSLHSPEDIRIFIKECSTLAVKGIDTNYIVPFEKSYAKNKVKIHGINIGSVNRLKRMTHTTSLVYEKSIKVNADIYHIHDPELIPIALKLKKSGRKVIYDVHEDMPRAIMSKYWIPKWLRKIVSTLFELYENKQAKKFDFVVGATPHIANRFLKKNKNTIDINNYPLLNELVSTDKTESKNRQVCYVGGINTIRGIHSIIKASTLVEGDIVLAGPTSSSELENEIKQSKINYVGLLSREEVNSLLNESIAGLVLYLPEPNHVNAQPNKMFEYMSAGIPVIASNFPLWKEIVEVNNCGICVNPTRPAEIADAIKWLIENPNKAAEMGRNGRQAVEDKYNWEVESEKLIKMYRSLEKKIGEK